MTAASRRPHATISASTTQNASKTPVSPRATALAAVAIMTAEVRRRNSFPTRGATTPPTICEPATMAATNPAIP